MALYGDLEALGNELAAQRDAIGGEVASSTHHHKATTAYRSADAVEGRNAFLEKRAAVFTGR